MSSEDNKQLLEVPGTPSTFYGSLDSVPRPISELLDSYSGIKPADQIQHILNVRNDAFKSHPYPCLGRFRFLHLDITSLPSYQTHILPTLTSNDSDTTSPEPPIFLDLGCCLGQDLRKLIHDGAPPSQLYGSDIVPAFVDNGYSLFRDIHKFPRSHFLVPGDVLAPSTSETDRLRLLDDRVSILHITAVFHLFPLVDQEKIVDRCLRLLRKQNAEGKSVLVIGCQIGNIKGQETPKMSGKGTAFRHDKETWEALWRRVVDHPEKAWKRKVKKMDVKSKLVAVDRVRRGVGGADGGEEVLKRWGDGFRWHMFEVWIEFTQ